MVLFIAISITIYMVISVTLTKRLLYMQSLLVSSRILITLVSDDDDELDRLLMLGLLLPLVMP